MNYDQLNQRFIKRTKVINDHWIWQGAAHKTTKHGLVTVEGRMFYLHRLIFCLKHGLDYDDKTFLVCHTCNKPRCWNPDHLYKGDYRTNVRDMIKARTHVEVRKTHCPRGHEYASYTRKDGKRFCLVCSRLRDKNRQRITINGKRRTIPGTRTL